MKIRIEKIISWYLNISRNECKKIIKAKRVLINNKSILKPICVDINNDTIMIDGKLVEYKEKQYFVFNKPSGYITANFDKKSKTIFEIIDLDPNKFFSYGRLDKDTEGLLIISNDGFLGHQIMNSKFEIPKTYYFQTNKPFDDKIKNHYPKPIIIANNYHVERYEFIFIDSKSAYITIYEGKFHQVKEMLNFFGYKITYLKRVSIGTLKLDNNLNLGEIKEICQDEINKILENCKTFKK
ncbi:pseudouridine synthase [Mycoplasma sp. 125]|uniref:pseudouridine synthase n=1 Tax=Mycoplasma sp. 125 TaxID=3447505 RepID=UPI003F65E3F0